MQTEKQYDFIIAGAGAAGLTLLWYLMQSEKLSKKRVLLIDKSLSPTDSKTWCFWSDGNHPVDHLIHHTWNELEVRTAGGIIPGPLTKKKYHCIRSIDYSAEILNLAKKKPGIDLLETKIEGFSGSGNFALAGTGDGVFSAPYIFQSALLPEDFHDSKADLSLLQHFTGWEIQTKKQIFDPSKALLMDFDVAQKEGATFFYLLPYSENSALVEYTLFSPEILQKDRYISALKDYLEKKLGLSEGDYSVIRKESGVVPMEDRRYSSWYCRRVLNLGTVGGFTKPTTGYTFSRIHQRCKEIVTSLEEKTPLPDHPISSYRFRVYDIMMLYLLQHEPKQAIQIFEQLFKKHSFDVVLQFLNEETHFTQELSIFSKLSYMPFFRSIYKMKHRLLTGA
jgi:lycopene beta-cyclase